MKLEQKAPALVAADTYRPAAMEQLQQLGQQIGVPVLGKRETGNVVKLVQDALREAESERARTVIVDTAGRLQIDAEMMDELKAVNRRGPGKCCSSPMA
jgi:signal recognition particle subunit SRP54